MAEFSPTVAALIPTMDRPAYVRGAIESACEQTHGRIEVVVVDASSEDDTKEVVNEMRRAYPDRAFTYIHNDAPRGLPAARNQGAAETDAEYIAFLDDDDRWRPEKIARQVNAFDAGGDSLGLVHTGYEGVDDDGERVLTFAPEYEGSVCPDLLVRNTIGTPSSVMVRRNAFEGVRGFDESLRYCEDWDFYLRIAREYEFDYVQELLVERTYHDGAMIEDLAPLFTYRAQVLEKHADILVAYGVRDQAWRRHYRDAGERHLKAGDRAEAKAAYYALLTERRDLRSAVVYSLLSVLPTGAVRRTVRSLVSFERRLRGMDPRN